MLTEINTQPLNISHNAAEAVREILTQKKLEGYNLRVYVSGGGCCGVQFGMALDNVVRDNDQVFHAEGINIIVDNMSLDYLRGADIEFVNDPQHGPGFVVNSPTANAGESCGCGGSCSCGDHAHD
jgi:iron-sulfur cluster assembly accessory protein